MADIGKINAVALANIAKVDAVAAAAIAKINGLVFSTAAAFLLDTYTGAAAGYSTRRLATSATVLMRVRRETAGGTGDDDEADVAYDSNNELSLDSAISNASAGVTATTLGQFLNVGTVNGTTYTNPDSLTVTASCFVDEWKDQSGNANHAEQTVQGNQPQIHSGTVNTDLILENGKPIIRRVSNASGLETSLLGNSTAYIFATAKVYSIDGHILISDLGQYEWLLASRNLSYPTDNGFTSINYYHNGSLTTYANQNAVYTDAQNQSLFTIHCNTSNVNNGYEFGLSNAVGGSSYGLYSMQEVIIYHSDQSSNRTGIESNVMTYFSIT